MFGFVGSKYANMTFVKQTQREFVQSLTGDSPV